MNDYLGYAGKVCVVTGASSGMGRALAEMLVDCGAEVWTASRREADIPGQAGWVRLDQVSRDSIDTAFAQLPGRIDCFFGVAGVSGVKNGYIDTFIIDFVANKYLLDTYLAERAAPGGSITFVTSTAGVRWAKGELIGEYRAIVEADGWDATIEAIHDLDMDDAGGTMAYMLAKRAMNFLVASKTAGFAARDVRINAVLPCSTGSRFMTEFYEAVPGARKQFEASVGNGKPIADPSVMGRACLYLGSELAEYVSGHCLVVDWGLEAATLTCQAPDMLGMELI
ncbi:SDR family oxidoreductase [Coriobacteriales bacterium OH1046]|nr:SDR family oxidoreductase [Coriobacteriales bacterium OH1046]